MHTKPSAVAAFVGSRIQATGKLQYEIAREAGFENPNVLTMIKNGKTKVPLARVGSLARALDTDPMLLMKMCLAEYQPETWAALEPMFDDAFTGDEVKLVKALRRAVGGPYVAALTPAARSSLDQFVRDARTCPQVH